MKHDFARHLNPVFVETGSWLGDGISAALKAGFQEVHSIELSPKYYDKCCKRFKDCTNVYLHLGDSGKCLYNIIKGVDNNITFWLDGHYSGTDTAIGTENVPLRLELDAIKHHHINTHTIMIDDLRLLREHNPVWGYLDYNENDLITMIKAINKDYTISYESTKYDKRDVLVASI
jgi:hypothetical protein